MSYQSVKAILSQGISRPTLYEVIMPGLDRGATDQLRFLCKTASVPEVSADTILASGHEALGVTREQPALVSFAKPFTITVVADRDYVVYKEMRRWFDTLARNANPYSRLGILGLATGASQRVNYYDTIKRQITLKKLEQNGEQGFFQPFEIEFNSAYPVRIGSIELDSESVDSRVEFTVDFTYETYTFDSAPRTVNYE